MLNYYACIIIIKSTAIEIRCDFLFRSFDGIFSLSLLFECLLLFFFPLVIVVCSTSTILFTSYSLLSLLCLCFFLFGFCHHVQCRRGREHLWYVERWLAPYLALCLSVCLSVCVIVFVYY